MSIQWKEKVIIILVITFHVCQGRWNKRSTVLQLFSKIPIELEHSCQKAPIVTTAGV